MKQARRGISRPLKALLLLLLAAGLISLLFFIYAPHPNESKVLLELDSEIPLTPQDEAYLMNGTVFTDVYPYARTPAGFSTSGSRTMQGTLYRVTAPYLQALRADLLEGRILWQEDAGRQLVLLSEGLAIRLYGSTQALGETLQIEGQQHTVAGILKTGANPVEKLARYGENAAYMLQDPAEPLLLTHIEGLLNNTQAGTLGINWLLRVKAIGDHLKSYANLAQSWSNVELLARGFISLCLLLLWKRYIKNALMPPPGSAEAIRLIWQSHYFKQAARQSLRPLSGLCARWLLTALSLGAVILFFLRGVRLPTEYIPKKFLFEPIKQVFLLYVYNHNTALPIAHPLTALISWWRKWVLLAGGGSLLILNILLKRGKAHAKR